MTAIAELNTLEREWQATLTQPSSPEKSRQLRLIEQQREGLWAKRRRELAGYTNGNGYVSGDLPDPELPDQPIPKTDDQLKRSESMVRSWQARKAVS